MKRVEPLRFLIDTNILLDVMLDRRPWSHEAVLLFEAIHGGEARGFVSAHAVTTVHYVLRKAVGAPVAREGIRSLLQILEVVPVDAALLKHAMELHIADFEDAVHGAAAVACGATAIVTRDHRDFGLSPTAPIVPAIALVQINEHHRRFEAV